MLRVAPFSWSRDQDSKPERAQALMAVALGEPSECVVIDADGEVPAPPSCPLLPLLSGPLPPLPAHPFPRLIAFDEKARCVSR
jgi:hypothetical protein